MKEQWRIRKAAAGDSVGLQACMRAAYASYTRRMGGRHLPPMDVDYSLEIKNFPCWIADLNGTVAGGIIMMFEEEYASIVNIAVHPEFQGQGLGAGLMNFGINKAKEMNYSELRLATHVLLTENISLYLHLGWSEIARDDVRVYFKKEI